LKGVSGNVRGNAPNRPARKQKPLGNGSDALPIASLATGCCTLVQPDRLGLLSMLQRCSRAIALAVMVAALSMAQEACTVLPLACSGTPTTSDDAVAKPVSMGIVIDLKAGKIDGFFRQFRAEISTNQTKWVFTSIVEEPRGARLSGSVDRTTGDLEA